jgi:arginine:agmatine antiporter
VAAVAYCLWTVLGGDPKTVVDALVALLLSVPLYPFFMKSMENVAKRKEELRLAAPAGSFHS